MSPASRMTPAGLDWFHRRDVLEQMTLFLVLNWTNSFLEFIWIKGDPGMYFPHFHHLHINYCNGVHERDAIRLKMLSENYVFLERFESISNMFVNICKSNIPVIINHIILRGMD